MSKSIISEINSSLSSGYEIITEYQNVSTKGNNNTFLYIVGGPSTRAIRRIELTKIANSIKVPGYKFFYIDRNKSFRYNYRYRKLTMSSEIGFVIGLTEQDYNSIKDNIPDDESLWSKSSPSFILTLKPKVSAEKSFEVRPANIPGVPNNKITCDQLKELTLKYVQKSEPDLVPLFTSYFDDLSKSNVSKNVTMVDFGSESLEIFSAYSLVHELIRKTQLRRKLGIPNDSKNGWQIMFPSQQNLPLVDYYIYFPGATEEQKIKVSVKNAFKGKSPNTITPKNLFETTKDLTDWYKSNKSQSNQVKTFWGGVSLPSSPGKTNNLYPLESVKKFNKSNFVSLAQGFLISYGVREINGKSLKKEIEYLYDYIKRLNVRSLKQNGEIADHQIRVFLTNTILKKVGDNSKAKPNITALSFLCEKIFEYASRKNGEMNFLKMFYDRAIFEKQVIYSTAKDSKNGNEVRLYFETIGMYNWDNFTKKKNWMSLRSKNTAATLGYGALGIDPRLF